MVHAPLKWPIASVVGLNEAGKTFLLDAIWKVMTGESFELADVCRYSLECRIEKTGLPTIGLQWESISAKLIETANALPAFRDKPIPPDALAVVTIREENNRMKRRCRQMNLASLSNTCPDQCA
jgi:hypothetical protein